MILQSLRRLSRRLGFDVVRIPRPAGIPTDCDPFTRDLIRRVAPYTLTTPERIMALVDAVRYVVRAQVPGALLECGVWRGGSMMVVAETLMNLGVADRDLYLFDTFTHMPEPGEHDFNRHGVPAIEVYRKDLTNKAYEYLPYDEVVRLLRKTGYPVERMHFVKGMVEDTLPARAPDRIALCRLDTDWYQSTAHEMRHLYPILSSGGILLVDDYGCFAGAKKAVDEFFVQKGESVYLNRIDREARLVIKR